MKGRGLEPRDIPTSATVFVLLVDMSDVDEAWGAEGWSWREWLDARWAHVDGYTSGTLTGRLSGVRAVPCLGCGSQGGLLTRVGRASYCRAWNRTASACCMLVWHPASAVSLVRSRGCDSTLPPSLMVCCSRLVAPQALRLHHHLSPAFAVQFLVCLGALALGWRVVIHYKGRTVSAPSAKGATQEGLDRLPAAAAQSRSNAPTPGVHYAHTVPGN